MTASIVVTLAPARDVSIVLFGANASNLELGTAVQTAEIALAELYRGTPGPKGDQGDQGIQGVPGAAGGTSFIYSQGNASSFWAINHQLGRYPSVTVVDSAGTEVEGDVRFIDSNHITVAFAFPFAGQAFLN